jgi:polyisoprenoid-binding protein YceI
MTTMTTIAAGTWTADLAQTRAAFAARHLFGSTVQGTIAVTAGTIEVGTDGRPVRLHATLDPASIDTGNARRDSDLRGRRFLALDAHPLMEVAADRIAATARGWHADAVLRGRGREAPVVIDATLDGAATALRLQVSGTARLDLRDLGIRVPGWLVRRFVDLRVSAQLTRQA